MSSLKIYEWNKKIKLVIVVILLIPVTTFLYIMIENYIFNNKLEYIRENVKLGMYKSDIVKILGSATDSGYTTEEYEVNTIQDSLSLTKLINAPEKSYLIYSFGDDFFKKDEDLSLTFDSLDILIEIKSPHF